MATEKTIYVIFGIFFIFWISGTHTDMYREALARPKHSTFTGGYVCMARTSMNVRTNKHAHCCCCYDLEEEEEPTCVSDRKEGPRDVLPCA